MRYRILIIVGGSYHLYVHTAGTNERRDRQTFVRCQLKCEKMVYSTYKKQRIIYWFNQGLKAPSIAKALEEERLSCSRCGIAKFLKVYQATGSIARQPGSGRPSKITAEIKRIVEGQMRLDDETTVYQLHRLLTEKGYSISLRTILWCRTALG